MNPDDKAVADWLVQTCLLFGSQTSTAYKVAGLFIEALESNREERALNEEGASR